jgi:hypothetical protein
LFAVIEKYKDFDSYLEYKRHYCIMMANRKKFCEHRQITYECIHCYKWNNCRNCNERCTNTKYRLYCKQCFLVLFPHELVLKNERTRELSVIKHIKDTFNQYKWLINKSICGLKRISDIFLELEDRYIMIEVDENQHRYYDKCDENKRISQITLKLDDKYLFIIHFNTDSYIDKNGTPILSPWIKRNGDYMHSLNTYLGLIELQCEPQEMV